MTKEPSEEKPRLWEEYEKRLSESWWNSLPHPTQHRKNLKNNNMKYFNAFSDYGRFSLGIQKAYENSRMGRDGQADNSFVTPSSHLNVLAIHDFISQAIASAVEARENKIGEHILAIGHNDECMFCGFKDKFATSIINPSKE